jgi:predicted nucleic acid-binding protein
MLARAYLDSSALAKLVLPAPESAALRRDLEACEQLVSSRLGAAELRRACARTPYRDIGKHVNAVVARLLLVDVSAAILETAGRVEPVQLRTLDAIHLATALSLGPEVVELITYDTRLARAARQHGLTVRAPR